jgi:hypothetical protein
LLDFVTHVVKGQSVKEENFVRLNQVLRKKACLIFQKSKGGGKLFVMPNKLLGSQNYPPIRIVPSLLVNHYRETPASFL